jgi:hypothetical protein
MKRLGVTIVLALCCSTVVAALAEAQQYVNEFPEPARVIAAYDGPDSLDRTARQHAALRVLRQVVVDMMYDRIGRDREGGRPHVWQTPDEYRLERAYALAEGQLREPGFDLAEWHRLGAASPRSQWHHVVDQYAMLDTVFRDDVLQRFFSPAWVAGYLAATRRVDIRVAASKKSERDANRPSAQQSRPQARRSPSSDARRSAAGTQLREYTVVALLLLALGFAREIRRFGLDGSDPFTIRSGWTRYQVHSSTGTVLSPTKSRVVTTHVSGGGAGNQPISSSTSTSIHDQFFIRESNGYESGLQVTDMNLALRDGHQVSAVWGIRKGKKTGAYIVFRNHTTRNVDFVDSKVKAMLQPSIWPVFPLIFTAVVVGAGAANGCMWCSFSITKESSFSTAVIVMVGFAIVRAIARTRRVHRLKRQLADMLFPILDQRATA